MRLLRIDADMDLLAGAGDVAGLGAGAQVI